MRFSEDGRRLILGGNVSEGLYDESIVRTLDIQFESDGFWAELTAGGGGGPMGGAPSPDIMASLTIEGETYDSVFVRIKGQTSDFMNNSQKKSFNVTMDSLIGGQDVMGYETLNLNGGFQDPSAIREVLFNHIGRQYNPSLQTSLVQVTLNGQNWGPYANVQQLNGEFLKEWFWNNNGTRWRALKTTTGGGPGGPGGGQGGPFGTGFSTLNYLGNSVADYEDFYTLKTTQKENPWEDLVQVCDKLNNLPLDQLADSLRQYMDVDKALWFLAHEIIFTDEDSYVWKGGMDYYVYWDEETNLITPLEYDGNSCMLNEYVTWSPFYNEQDSDYPLMNRLFAVPELKQRYLAHVRTILNEYMDIGTLNGQINSYVSLINDLVENDPKAIYSYDEFIADIEDVKGFLTDRKDFLMNHAEINVPTLAIEEVTHLVNDEALAIPQPEDEVVVTANISGTMGVDKVVLYYASGLVGVFDETLMYDDGAHNDGSAGDGIYGGTIPAFTASSYVRYYVEAIADDAAKTASYMPQRAEQDVYIYQVGINEASFKPIAINEIMASNNESIADEVGDFDDWIELYNLTDESIDLSGYYLTDNVNNLLKWEIPTGTILNANEYLIVWADENGSQGDYHANFKLSSSGETLMLLNSAIEIVDQVAFENLESDKGFARVPNGTGDFVLQDHTFGMNNEVENTSLEAINASIQVFPNPATTLLSIELTSPNQTVEIINVSGQIMWKETIQKRTQLKVEDWAAGIYYVKTLEGVKKIIVN